MVDLDIPEPCPRCGSRASAHIPIVYMAVARPVVGHNRRCLHCGLYRDWVTRRWFLDSSCREPYEPTRR